MTFAYKRWRKEVVVTSCELLRFARALVRTTSRTTEQQHNRLSQEYTSTKLAYHKDIQVPNWYLMGDKDKKPPPPSSLGSIHPKYGRPPPGVGDRLEGLNPSRDNIGVPKAPPQFKPNIVGRVKREPKGDEIDSKLKGPMAQMLDESTFQQHKLTARRKPVKPAAGGTDTKAGVSTAKSPFMGGPGTGGTSFKKKEKIEGDGDAMDIGDSSYEPKKHELEIDSSNPNHPSVLPFVEPQNQKELERRRAMEKEDDAIMAEVKQKVAQLAMEEEKAVPEVLLSSLDVPTPLMVDGDFLNEDNLFFIQLPSSLPFTPPPPTPNNPNANTPNKPEPNTTNPNPPPTAPQRPPQKGEYVNSLRGVSGHLGKIVVYKSGKVKLRVGDILYDITAANNPNFLEELMVLEGSNCYRVGPMSQHLIVTPDIEDLLQKADKV